MLSETKRPTSMQKFALEVRAAGISDRLAVQLAGLRITPFALYMRRYRYRKANGINAHAPKYRSWQLSTCKNI